MSGKKQNQQAYIENGQFSGGENITPNTGSDFATGFGYTAGGLYVGEIGNLTVRTVDGSVLTLVSASGFIPGLINAVSGSTTAGSIVAFR